ncbi:MAG: hypothetical protein RIS33_1557 [Actinomycetota bacterium]|jgi:hypothetical protein
MFAQRRRLAIAIAVTVIAVIAFAVSGNGSGDDDANVSGTGTAVSIPSGAGGDSGGSPAAFDTSPADPAFLPDVDPSIAPEIITVNVPAPPAGTVLDGTASYVRWPQTLGLRPCATPHALIGAVITVTNLNNGRQIKCNNVSIEALRDGSVIIVHTDVFLDLADLVDAPIPVEINF